MPPAPLHVFPSFVVGGAQLRFAAIANRFPGRWRHLIVAMDGVTTCRERLDPGVLVGFPAVDVRKGDTFGNLRRFRACLRAVRPAALVTGNWGAIEWAMANLIPLARHIHVEDGFGPEERDRQLPRRVWTRRLVLRRVTVVLPSRRLETIARDVWKLPPSCLRYVPNGVDLARFAPAPDGGERAVPVIGCIAGLRAEKNVARLLRATARVAAVRPCRLIVAGGGPERAALEAEAAALGIGGIVTFAGEVADAPRCYREFDVFALSSDTEQMPLTVLEAMASALPVVTTDVGDIAAMVAPDNRPFVVARDDAALADALLRLLADAALRRHLGAANRVVAERDFDQKRMFATWAGLYDGADSGGSAPKYLRMSGLPGTSVG
jgi:glycosyltransferase involved in cell wall biosynthesis